MPLSESRSDQPFATAIRASAGSGKTRALIARIVRLLLSGAEPGAILAITFTNKAAQEIRARVGSILADLAVMPPELARTQLQALDCPTDTATLVRAASLYEAVLTAEQPIQTTTFHAFCHTLLTRFSVEAQISPGYRLVENTVELERAAWRAFEREAALDSALAQTLNALFKFCDGLSNTREALDAFLRHRSDWRAFTEDRIDPVGFAFEQLTQKLDIADAIAIPSLELQQYAALIGRHDTATHRGALDAIEAYVADPARGHESLWSVFLTEKSTVRALSPKLLRVLADDQATRLRSLHLQLAEMILAAHRRQLTEETLTRSRDWYFAGSRLLACYESVKAGQNVLDFADLEWSAYRLLNRSDHAEWVQYKLDQRIDHILIDEFQDTNPTQWRLLQPLLQEIASDRREGRSVFLVGDEKQSIYRFRRAQPALFASTRQWLKTLGNVEDIEQTVCWRSSPAIVDFVNLMFSDSDVLPNFATHTSGHPTRWGEVTVWPLIAADEPAPTLVNPELRNPLQAPRAIAEDVRYRRDAARVADAIAATVGHRVVDATPPRVMQYRDVLILMRERINAAHYEDALRRRGIPYIDVSQTRLDACLEVVDVLQLLRWLRVPTDNLALAGALKSPLFGGSDDELRDIAHVVRKHGHRHWWAALQDETFSTNTTLFRARGLLGDWLRLADTIPVHDLLDRIYNEGNLMRRYDAGTPPHLAARIRANLQRLLSLALEVDAGRYPSIARFVEHITTVGYPASEGSAGEDCVRLMTIHGAKGLEAPVVFLVDSAREAHRTGGVRALIEWPADAERPTHFHLVGKADTLDPVSAGIVERQAQEQRREDFNLLYVALTRAKQALYIGGCEPKRGAQGWYGFIKERLARHAGDGARDDMVFYRQHGLSPPAPRAPAAAADEVKVDARLSQPIKHPTRLSEILQPSATAIPEDGARDARARGSMIHRGLQLLSEEMAPPEVRIHLAREFSGAARGAVDACIAEAHAVVKDPQFRKWYDRTHYVRAMNELPILFEYRGRSVSGTVDRAIFFADEVLLIEYKTQAATADRLAQLRERYSEQLRLYAHGARLLWPQYRVGGILLFTANRCRVDVEL